MSQPLNTLVVSEQPILQRDLEKIMLNNVPGYHAAFITQTLDTLPEANRAPDLIFIENRGGLTPEDARRVIHRFPRKIYVVIDGAPKEAQRRAFLKAGVDEVMSLTQLQSDVGRHLLEKLLTARQVTEAEDRIAESEERFRGIIEHARDIITLLDEEGTIIYNSQAFERLLGYESWEVLGQEFSSYIHEEDRAYVAHRLREFAAGDADGAPLEFRFRHKDGRWRVFEVVVSNLLKNALVRALVLNSRDVTEQKESEAELESYRHHLEDLVEKRTQELSAALEKEKAALEQQKIFISMVSHEFRTPLTIIDGNAQIVQSRGAALAPDVLAGRAGTIRSAVGRLVLLIETILSAHTLESGRLTLTLVPTDLAALVRDVCAEQADIAPSYRIQTDIAAGLPEMMLDAKVIRQAVTNLVSNAVKYSPDRFDIGVVVRQEGGRVIIEVTDHGVGIPEAELPKIFTRYFRASTSGGIPGSGLGLSLVKQFVELHGGRIDIQSKVGSGTRVTVTLPVRKEHA